MSTRRQQLQDDIARVAESFLRVFGGIAGRMTVFVWLSTVTFLVIYLLSETLTTQEAAKLDAVFHPSVGGVEVSVFSVFVFVTALWVVSPCLLRVVEFYQEVRES